MKKKILKIIGIILLVVIAIFLIHTIRNYVIISDLQEKISKYVNSTNYRTKSVTTENDGSVVTMEYYKKDNKEVVFLERMANNEVTKISMYSNGERTDVFTETKDSKVAQLNSGTIMSLGIYNHLENDSKWQTILGCISAKIKSVDYNGKECYIVKEFMSSNSLTSEVVETYIDKETGLFVKSIDAGIVNEREYEFNTVDDSIFTEPDISQYTLKEKA